ncbi:MAG: hypothetical protein SGJ00_12225 [bacterium]|nr:hypothetical protein [bacterium]
MESYYEQQKFNKWYIWVVLSIPFIIFLFGAITGKMQGEEQHSMLIANVIVAFVFVLFIFTKLETRIDELGITIRFFPFQRVYYYVKWEDVESCSVRTYKPLREYGGWGLRYSFKNGKAYNVAGTKGLQLVLKSGNKFLIGTQNNKELSSFLDQLKTKHGITAIEVG